MASPRSGSNYLEELIFRMISTNAKQKDPSIGLGEYLHDNWHSFYTSTGQSDYSNHDFNSDFRIKFRDNINNIIEYKPTPMVMRIFPQVWHKNKIDLDEFFSFLNKNNFKFVYLRRNFIDRLISLSVAKTTCVWNKRIYKDNRTTFGVDGVNTISISQKNKITINLETIARDYYDTKMNDFYLESFFKKFPGEIVNYETIIYDCTKLRIPIRVTTVKKLYDDILYSDLIDNYQEVLDFIEFFKK